MKKLLPLLVLVFLISCSKKDVSVPLTQNDGQIKKFERCTFGIQQFNTVKRSSSSITAKGKPLPKGDLTTLYDAVILLDFDGATVSNTPWNTTGDIVCAPANLSIDDETAILDQVTEDYRPFKVNVTTDEAVYQQANVYKRMRVIVTESWEWYGQAGGTSYVGSFTWGNETPCFIFSTLLNYNQKYIAEAAAHEAGHTLGLRHQAAFDNNCILTDNYNYGTGAGVTGWAPIMGCAYYQNITTWHNGPTSAGCTSMQDDVATITGVLAFKADDYSDKLNTAATLDANKEGVINTTSDVDAFVISSTVAKTISIQPFALANNTGSDLDLLVKVYDKVGTLLYTISDPQALGATLTLNAGKYYITVEATANTYAPKYGMMGKYFINIT